MTRHEAFSDQAIAEKEIVIATDLDGTFLGGSDQDRARFYDWVESNRDRVGLVFVTGRDPDFITDLTRNNGVPKPDYAVADVGTTIATVGADHVLTPVEALEAEIAQTWGDSNTTVKAALSDVRGLTLQPTEFRYRVSYDLDADTFEQRALDIVAELGHDALISDNRFFDVLPKGVSKGPSLVRLLAHLGVEQNRCLVAGDTMNDLSMLKVGLPAVAVGGSEAALLEVVSSLEHVHKANAIGAAGIAEAISHFNMFKHA